MVRAADQVLVRGSPYVPAGTVLAVDTDTAHLFGLPAEPWKQVLVACPPEHQDAVAEIVAQIRKRPR